MYWHSYLVEFGLGARDQHNIQSSSGELKHVSLADAVSAACHQSPLSSSFKILA